MADVDHESAPAARAARALGDAALVAAMRAGDAVAWAEFVARFTPLLEGFARRTGIPRWEWEVCVHEVLEDEAMRIATPRAAVPRSLAAYLVRAVHHRWLRVRRGELRRARRDDLAMRAGGDARQPVEYVMRALCSAHSLRASEGPELTESVATERSAIDTLTARVLEALPEADVLLLTWMAEGVPRRQIAEWLGVSYEAARKRVLRLAHRVRDLATTQAAALGEPQRGEVLRVLRRANDDARQEAHDER
ncbi:MAG TPA: hypothetical protein VEA99_16700 [Gemmatimonadaceae bacterium]|nr:hypothetical protein [Gemmatimonadaceae bacterium]